MRKFLLTLTVAVLAATAMSAVPQGLVKKDIPRVAEQTRAGDETLVFGYCTRLASRIGLAGADLKAAIGIPESTAAAWKGNTLTGIRVGFGSVDSPDPEITLFLTYDPFGKPFYTQTVDVNELQNWNEYTLDVPYEISGEELFVGYEYKNCMSGEYPIGVDGVPTNIAYAGLIYDSQSGTWGSIASNYGSNCIQLIIKGNNLPQNYADIYDVTLPFSVKPGEAFDATVEFINQGVKSITNVDFEVSVNGVKVENPQITVSPKTVATGAHAVAIIKNLQALEEMSDAAVEVTITGVNGNVNESKNNGGMATIAVFTEGVTRKMLVEEWTGTWCGWCPRGIVGMEYMRETYGDEDFIGIAVHDNDPMMVPEFYDFLDTWGGYGYPGCAINRTTVIDPSKGNLYTNYRKVIKTQSYATVDNLSFDTQAAGQYDLSVSADVTFLVPVTNGDYRFIFVITEDSVGRYNQTNYYSPSYQTGATLAGWDTKGPSVATYFNDVARTTSKWDGIEGSVPANVAAYTPVSYSTTLPLDNVKDLTLSTLVAMVVNGRTGEVIAAEKLSLDPAGVAGVDDDVEIVSTEYITLDGRKVLNPDKGIYIVKTTDANGRISAKKIIK